MKMKKVLKFGVLAALALTLWAPVRAAGLTLDEKAVLSGMDGKSWYQGYQPATSYNTMTVYLPIRQENAAGPLTAEIALDDPDVYLFKSAPAAVTVEASEGLYPVKLSLPLVSDRRNGDYPATVTLTAADENGKLIEETLPYILRVRDGWANPERLRPAISQVEGRLDVGTEGTLRLTVENPTATLSMTDCELTITDATGEVLMSGSDRLAVPEILPGQRAALSVPVTVLGSAKVSPHCLAVKLTYQVLDQAQTWEETFTLPVTQAIRLESGGVALPATAEQGELTSLSLPLMNMGRGQLINAMATLELEGVTQRQSVLVGTLEPGETKEAKLTFTPSDTALGEYQGTVTVTCEDAYGNSGGFTADVSLTVEAAPPAQNVPAAEDGAGDAPDFLAWGLGGGCVLLFAALILQGCLLRARIHKLEEDKL